MRILNIAIGFPVNKIRRTPNAECDFKDSSSGKIEAQFFGTVRPAVKLLNLIHRSL